MFGFLKKKEVDKEVERHEIPDDHRMEVYEFADKWHAETGGRREKFALWNKIQKIFPDLDIAGGDWVLDTHKILSPSIFKRSSS